jgi:hypothetical protein
MEDVPDIVNIFVWNYKKDLTDFSVTDTPSLLHKLIVLKFLPFNAEYITFSTDYAGPKFIFNKETVELDYDLKSIK